ncbi:MAG TPA: Nif3-like dinuclear metal center hexameric protein [Nocardioidaceae bacterium]|jgi:dinuclear metal center YbgI/SA1388 family protein
MAVRLTEVTGLLDEMYDPSWAEGWDAVGLVCGEPDQEVSKILFAVDPAPVVVDEAVEWGADLLVVHHPLLLRGVHGVAATTPKGRSVHRLLRNGCALFTAHTNADTAAGGVNEALADALGLQDSRILDPADGGMDKIVTFAPHEDAARVREAITVAGAGVLGNYDSCTFTVEGEGRFRPLHGAAPAIGQVGEVEVVSEARIEAVLPRARRRAVVEAMRAAHPYEEPAFDLFELAGPSGSITATRGHGRVGRLPRALSLRGLAEHVASALPSTAHGVRVGGDPDRTVETVAVQCGAGDFLLDSVLRSGADAFLTSDLRHHPASEFLEHGGPALLDVAHWAAEWTWLPVVERRLAQGLDRRGDTVETRVSTTVTDPWTFRVDR